MKNSLIIGMGIGQLYQQRLEQLKIATTRVDLNPDRSADYQNVADALTRQYLTAHICTPNHTHESIADQIADHASIVFIEKPGVQTADNWQQLVNRHPYTRFMMVKNNQYRDNAEQMQQLYLYSNKVRVHWINRDRVPNPGTWFTNRELAFGGVSRDLLPHLLSLYTLLEPEYASTVWTTQLAEQRWQLKDLTATDYGTVNPNGVYNVDDRVELTGHIGSRELSFIADWRSDQEEDIAIYFDDVRIPLGLCPDRAYGRMIQTAIDNYENDEFWQQQLAMDLWIQRTIEL